MPRRSNRTKTIINLRLSSSDHKLVEGTTLVPVDIPAEPWDLEEADIVAFLRVVADPARTPVFVHCSHGADRTGAMTAIYRIAVQGWDKEEAIREMTHGGFGDHTLWDNLPATLRKLDIGALKAKAAGRQQDHPKRGEVRCPPLGTDQVGQITKRALLFCGANALPEA